MGGKKFLGQYHRSFKKFEASFTAPAKSGPASVSIATQQVQFDLEPTLKTATGPRLRSRNASRMLIAGRCSVACIEFVA